MKTNYLDIPGPAELSPSARTILATAAELFYSRGITAVGVDLIADESGVTKRTLYNQFGSKDALVAAYLTDRDQRWRALVEGYVEAAADSSDALLAPFDALHEWMQDNSRGCAFVNALAELPDKEHPGHKIAVAEKQWLLDLFSSLVTRAEIPRPGYIAEELLLLHEGALALSASLPGIAKVEVVKRVVERFLESVTSG